MKSIIFIVFLLLINCSPAKINEERFKAVHIKQVIHADENCTYYEIYNPDKIGGFIISCECRNGISCAVK